MDLTQPSDPFLIFWTQLLVLLAAARGLGALMRRVGQPAVIGELAAGLLLGPSVLGQLAPGVEAWLFPPDSYQKGLLSGVGWVGVFLLLIVIGFETDLELIRRMRGTTARVAFGSLLLPFATGLAVGVLMPAAFLGEAAERGSFALFMATALSISALPVIARILSDLDLLRRNVGQITLAAGMVNDVVGWILLGVIAGLTQAGGFALDRLLFTVVGVGILLAAAFTLGQRGVDSALRQVRQRRSGIVGGLTVTLLLALTSAALAQAVGIEGVLGAFWAGILIGRSRFQDSEVIGHLEAVTLSVFAPIYFANAGLRVDLGLLAEPGVLFWGGVVLAAGSLSKLVGAFGGARLAGLPLRECAALGIALNARGAVEIVVATVGLSLGVLNASSYALVVLLAMFTSMIAPPLLRLVLRGWEGSPEEQSRLTSERRMRGNLLVRPERILLPSHGGPNSRLAARILDLAWPEGVPVTVLSAGTDVPEADLARVLAALGTRPVEHEHVSTDDPLAAILDHARLGYGAIALGATDTKVEGRLVSAMVDGLLAQSPLPIIMVRGSSGLDPDVPLRFRRILVPAVGTRPGRAAQEVAFSVAQRLAAEVVLAHVVTVPLSLGARGYVQPPSSPWSRGPLLPAGWADREAIAASVVQEARALAAEAGLSTTTAIRTGVSVAEEILALAREHHVDLVVLAANVRQLSGRPFLGHGVEYILEQSESAVVVVTAPPV